ncbi:MAG: hypothetical protein ACO3UK_07405, partial [Burkholderiaceae bacterium]
ALAAQQQEERCAASLQTVNAALDASREEMTAALTAVQQVAAQSAQAPAWAECELLLTGSAASARCDAWAACACVWSFGACVALVRELMLVRVDPWQVMAAAA